MLTNGSRLKSIDLPPNLPDFLSPMASNAPRRSAVTCSARLLSDTSLSSPISLSARNLSVMWLLLTKTSLPWLTKESPPMSPNSHLPRILSGGIWNSDVLGAHVRESAVNTQTHLDSINHQLCALDWQPENDRNQQMANLTCFGNLPSALLDNYQRRPFK
ncbi:hypothetical protein VP01_2017g1 [Puccinia sorghi]|uniref:Uncharacterized protein n=1 Tax=Puccinia sorghi TaxID=27349 RepID=A0A0L6VB35_9BASI|nr:hypothetical protein VP01_2017g1 [Puccinia sorghi]